MVHHHQPGDDAGILSRHHALEARISSHLCTLRPKRGKRILEHDFSENKLWLVKWLIDEPPGGTWENRETLNDVEAFQHYCTANTSNAFLPRSHPLWEASMPSTQRRTAAQLKLPEPPQDRVIGPGAEKKKRGRPVTKSATSMDIVESGVKQRVTRGRGRPRKERYDPERREHDC